MCVSGSPLGSFLEVHGEEEEAAAAENEDKENEETQVVIDKGAFDAIERLRLRSPYLSEGGENLSPPLFPSATRAIRVCARDNNNNTTRVLTFIDRHQYSCPYHRMTTLHRWRGSEHSRLWCDAHTGITISCREPSARAPESSRGAHVPALRIAPSTCVLATYIYIYIHCVCVCVCVCKPKSTHKFFPIDHGPMRLLGELQLPDVLRYLRLDVRLERDTGHKSLCTHTHIIQQPIIMFNTRTHKETEKLHCTVYS